MDWNVIDWLDLVLRWFHVMGGISWIGGSLYLLWLDRIFSSPERAAKDERGEPWLIDQVGSLLVEKLKLGPDGLAKTHIWFKRETTLAWVSGVLLLAMVAYLPGGGLLTDAGGQPIDALVATGIIAALLVLSWGCYDLLWRTTLSGRPVVLAIISYAIFVALAWSLTQIFSGRAVFILLGAVLGTLMMGNVWFRILPALKEMGEARAEGRPADAKVCSPAWVRSTHNSYLIFPTVVLMLSNHYPLITSHRLNWIVLCLLAAAFVGARHLVVSGRAGLWALYSAVAALGVAVFLIGAGQSPREPAGAGTVSFAAARGIIIQRCLSCHSTVPADRTFGPVPGGVGFDRPESIKRHAQRIKVRAVSSLTMPNRHESGMTPAERMLLGRWVDEGARLE
ncbi:MAG: urate hydroxylase PuuD [Rhodospirillales bacterium]|jgi:uncharacterized membrane protein|nr:hypothetical protein [Rhodospirillaceae bacterium]MDP6429270.1 urate hydroxylase PuuD [Rhodospirillales bacterium]MDP6643755.1 urate hydroxylase PuuD [Rhodospirillales bacterium]MDP6842111.1 urate hydroxylase PuuD [Rhodospirillales bacterium]